ncbi:hypothetical protein [Streptomyces sp. YPW6]|uniref:hypothetical protein n=1 Tax=Streptomyces sp. YPW6 TaxID=2840373 RepID=UPI003EB6E87B
MLHGHRLPGMLLRHGNQRAQLDHEAQLTDLRITLCGITTIQLTDFLDACEHVSLIQPSAKGRKAESRASPVPFRSIPYRAHALRNLSASASGEERTL